MALNILKKIQDMKLEMMRWRQNLHREPETAFKEEKTARFLVRQLKSFGFDEVHGMAKTGVIGVLHGKNGAKAGGPAIMLRSDMDALPICEDTGALHASRTPGVHHACGHDGHMAMLLGAAKHLAQTRDFDGTVYVVFQPAEEFIGGAREMIDQGLFQKFPCDKVFGLHNFPGLPLGMMATGEGAVLAASDEYHITFKGAGGHTLDGAATVDLIAAAAEAISAIKALAAKEVDGRAAGADPAALTTCMLSSDAPAANVLPSEVYLNGSVRSYDPALQEKLKDGISRSAEAAAEKFGATVTVEFKNGYPSVINAKAETDFAAGVAQDVVGADKVLTIVPKTLGVEDFSFYLQKKPGNFMIIGTGRTDGKETPGLHTAKYDFNDAALPIGASYWVKLVEKSLPLAGAKSTPAAPTTPVPPKLN